MTLYRKNPLFAVALTLCAVIALGELALTYERYAASRDAAKRLAQRELDLQGMAELMPPPTREVATAIEQDLAKAQAALAAMQAELKGRGPAAERLHAAKVPAARTDAYFDLATFVERMRDIARKNEVEIRGDAARFGFAAYANEGPMPEHIEPVFRQRQVAQYLVESLIEARPRAVFSVKRERTLSKAEREARANALANNEPVPELETGDTGPDYFVIDPRVTARVPNYIDTMPFRFVFTGQTAALRSFLNHLASFELPVLVREVEVEPATAEEAASQLSAEDAAANEPAVPANAPSVVLSADPVKPAAAKVAPRVPRPTPSTPIVAKPLSKFTVTVEFVELVTPPAAAPEGGSGTPTPTS